MKLFNCLYILCLIGLIGAFCGANFGLSYLTDRLRCALNYDLRVDMKINDDGTDADLGDLPVDSGGSGAKGADSAAPIPASPALKFPQFHISGVENLPTSGNAGEMMSTILKQITEKLNGSEELINLEDKLQRRVETLFADERMRNTVMRNLGTSNSLDLLRDVIDERYLTTAVHDAGAQKESTSSGAAAAGLSASLQANLK